MSSAFKKLIPTFNRIVIRKFEAQTTTKSGIILNQAQDSNTVGEVIAAGPGTFAADGKLIPVCVSVGDKVLLPEFGGQSVKVDNQDFLVVRDSEIIGKLEN